jgi:hypothetical protein
MPYAAFVRPVTGRRSAVCFIAGHHGALTVYHIQ